MAFERTRESVKQRILDAAALDPRAVGVVDYGATAEGRGDKWSDLDLALFIRDEDLELFQDGWESWSEQFGSHLVSFVGGVGNPWAVYDAQPMPLRVDFVFVPESEMRALPDWPNSPISVVSMALYDGSGGRLTKLVDQIVGKSLAPDDLESKFNQVASDFWYYLLRTCTKLMRAEHWSARHDFNFMIMGNLAGLLRIEAGKVDRWKGSSAMDSIEADLSGDRLADLEGLIVAPGVSSLQKAMVDASSLGKEVCSSISKQHGWPWPSELANRVIGVLDAEPAG